MLGFTEALLEGQTEGADKPSPVWASAGPLHGYLMLHLPSTTRSSSPHKVHVTTTLRIGPVQSMKSRERELHMYLSVLP